MKKYLLSAILLWSVTTVSLQAKTARNFVGPVKSGTKAKESKGVPYEINYQSWIGDASDTNAITDVLDMKFRLYDTETGGTLLWNETQSAVNIDKGIFNVLLGSITPIPTDKFTGDPLWLETQVATDTLSPRKKLVSVGYAIKSENADNATYADTANYALSANVTNVDSANVSGYAYDADKLDGLHANAFADTGHTHTGSDITSPVAEASHSVHADTADYALSASVGVVDSANVAANAWNWNNNLWGTEYPKANIADTANYVAGTNVDGEVAQANKADTAAYALSASVGVVDSANVAANAWNWNNNLWGTEYPKANIADTANYVAGADVNGKVAQANYADTAGYASSSAGDNDWTISGNNMYSAVAGSVGVGVPSPTEKLDVNGAVNVSSLYKIGGDKVLSNAGTNNIFVGVGAGENNTTGKENTFSGYEAGRNNTTGNRNTFSGHNAGYSNTTGGYNTFSGHSAGYSNTISYYNTFSGHSAGYSNTTGGHNTFSGHLAGYSNTGGSYNTFSGNYAGYSNTTGHDNTFTGCMAGYKNTTGHYNTFSGNNAGRNNTEGDRSVFIGYRAGQNETGSNKLYIANGEANANVLIYGEFDNQRLGIGTTSPAERLEVNGNCKADTFIGDGSQLTGISAPDNDWTISGSDLYAQNTSWNVGIGTTNPPGLARLFVNANGANYGVYGQGSNGEIASVCGSANGADYGVYGKGSTNKMAGVYGWASGATWGVYYTGGLGGTGKKSTVVRASKGPTEMYCIEATELWFEDFGTGRLVNGQAQIDLDQDFLETVTIDANNPMKVFIQLADDCNGVYVKKGATSFEVMELGKGTSNANFDYRIVAKRKDYETQRMKVVESCYTDKLLYPDDNDPAIPLKWRQVRQKQSEAEIRAKEAGTK